MIHIWGGEAHTQDVRSGGGGEQARGARSGLVKKVTMSISGMHYCTITEAQDTVVVASQQQQQQRFLPQYSEHSLPLEVTVEYSTDRNLDIIIAQQHSSSSSIILGIICILLCVRVYYSVYTTAVVPLHPAQGISSADKWTFLPYQARHSSLQCSIGRRWGRKESTKRGKTSPRILGASSLHDLAPY